MRFLTLFFLSLVILSGSAPANAQVDEDTGAAPVILTDEREKYSLGLHLQILEDPGGELTIEDVASPEFDPLFVSSGEETTNIGFSEDVHWVRLHLRNETTRTDQWLLDVAYANIHFVDLYTPLPDREGFGRKLSGVLRPPEWRDIPHPRIIFKLSIPTEGQQTIYLRFQSGASTSFPLNLWTTEAFLAVSQWEQVIYGLYFGILIALLLFNLFLLLSLRDVSYLYLVILLASMVAFDAAYTGYLEVYIIPKLYDLRLYYIPLSFSLMFGSMILFADSFLELRMRLARLHTVNLGILGVWGLLVLLIPFTSYYQITIPMVLWALPSLLVVLLAGIVSWLRGFHPARFFLIAWLGLIVTLLLVLLVRLGAVNSTTFTENAFRLGWVWMAVCWSIALADRINLLKVEAEDANLDLQQSEHRLSEILEGLPLGVAVYGKDSKPNFANRRVQEILSNPDQGIEPDLTSGRTLAQAMEYFSFRVTGSSKEYPLENFPVYRALLGEPASADDIEADLIDKRVPLEIWASPVRDDMGKIESVVVAFQDITRRKQADNELDDYRKHLELLVENRTAELSAINEQLSQEVTERVMLEQALYQRIKWLSALHQVRQSITGAADLPQAYKQLTATILMLLDAEALFFLHWDGQSEQIKAVCQLKRVESTISLEGIESVATNDSPLRKEIDLGQLMKLSADQAVSLPAPLGGCFKEDAFQSLILSPMVLRQSVAGVLGVALTQPKEDFSASQGDLIETITVDLAGLMDDAHLLDKARALVAAEERGRLARDLHDSVTQVLFSGSLVAEVLPQIWRRDPALAMESLEELRRLTRGALAEMRTMLLELRPQSVLKTTLPELLAQLTEAVTTRTDLPFQLSIEQIPSLPEDVHISFYRIAQEALNNVVKHAQARQVDVSLSAVPLPPDPLNEMTYEVKLVIEDDGVGYSIDSESPENLGFGIMRERATDVRANLAIESQVGYGTKVTMTWRNLQENTS